MHFLRNNYKSDYFTHDKEIDTLFCPSGKPMHNIGNHKLKKSGQVAEITIHRAINCSGYSLKDKCYKGKGNRKVDVNHTLKDYKEKLRQLLKSEQVIYHRKKSV